jgi:WD40 repeat protein
VDELNLRLKVSTTRPPFPYPGLRPFEPEEWSIFFGRELMVDEVIERLAHQHFVVIHGASGSGKSSLARAGILPKLARQHLRHGVDWLTCAMRPSGGPLWNLAAEFARLDGRNGDLSHISEIIRLFNRRGATLSAVTNALDGLAGKRLCILVDQFEELFRFERESSREEAELFIELLIGEIPGELEPYDAAGPNSEAATKADCGAGHLHIVVTMRSEFLGECARFDRFAEVINRAQYLVPRLKREALMRAIQHPAHLYGGEVTDELAERLIADVRGKIDELPLVQHGLLLFWRTAAQSQLGAKIFLDAPMLDRAGGLTQLLSNHADSVMHAAAADEPRKIAIERLFRALTDISADGQPVRRPQSLLQLVAVCGISTDGVRSILDAFRAEGVSLLTPYFPTSVNDKTIVDISHESLIRHWDRLRQWVEEEAESGEWYRRVEDRKRHGGQYLVDPELASALRARENWNKAWAERYATRKHDVRLTYDEVIGFLDESQKRSRDTLSRLLMIGPISFEAKQTGERNARNPSLIDLSYVERKCADGRIPELLAEYDDALRSAGLADDEWAELAGFARFIRAEKQLLEAHPALTLQQALNSPDFTAPAAAARRAAKSETRPCFRWVNKPQTPSPCVRTLLGHRDYVNSCDVAPDGERIVSASSDTKLKVWDAATGNEISTLVGHTSSVETCAFSPDCKRILSGARNGEVKIWDAASGDKIRPLTGHNAPVLSCKFSPDGTRAVSASRDGTLKIWQANNGLELHTLRGRGDQMSCAYSPDGNWIVAGGKEGHLTLWDSSTGKELFPFGDHEKAITGCVFTPDGKSVVSASEDHTVRRWDVATRQVTNTYGEYQQAIWALAVSPCSNRLATGAQDGSIAFWDVESAQALARVTEHVGQVSALAFFPDGSRVLSGSWDGALKIWSVQTAEQIEREQGAPIGAENAGTGAQQHYMICCCRSPDGAWFAAGSSDGSLTLWDAATGAALGVFPLHRDFVMTCVFSPDSRWIVSGSWDGSLRSFDRVEQREGPAFRLPDTIFSCAFSRDGKRMVAGCASVIMVWDVEGSNVRERCAWHPSDERFVSCAAAPDGDWIVAALEDGRFVVWDVDREAPVRSFEGDRGVVCCTLSPDGRRLASACDAGALRIWDVPSGRQLRELFGHDARVVSCNFSADGRRLVSGSWDQTVRIWELEIPDRVMVLSGHTDQLQDACFTADGNRILSVAVDGTARLWDAATCAWLGCLLSPEDSASLCTYSPDRRYFLTASHRHSLKLWNGATGQLERVLVGHRSAVRACGFSVQGQLVSASTDGTLKLWDVASSEPLRTLVGHTGPVQSCAFSPDGSWIVSGGWDKTVRLWSAGNGEVFATLWGHDDWVQVVLVAADGSRIVSCSHDKTIVIWDVATGQRIHTLIGHDSVINAAALSADGSRLVTGSEDGILNVWELGTGRRISTLTGHTGAIRDCAFTDRILSASHDRTLRLWKSVDDLDPLELRGHAGPVLVCRFSPDGKQALSGSVDQFVKLWDCDTGALLGEYSASASVQSIAWQAASRRIALGDGAGKLHLLELEGALQ